ncbi:hypothetical protein VM1G_09202 [Cytospora mali]|uniref:Uncharacterized protein n=1 Tax=Cytospora mali TaxID=578113 RepID=A0A194WCP7_CYTMA|nr:hypothetical protein VM1G_09202 [Valsa mali]
MTQPTQARRRFAPVPVETTFKEHRRAGPTSEPTPEPSPTSESPPSMPPKVVNHETQTHTTQTETHTREKRRFAPRLLESSRRSRRAGDVGPATRPADKTDITPYAKHIYSLSSKKKHNRRPGHARRESCDDEIADHVFDLNKLEAQKRLEELAMMAFPNSTVRLGGAEHFIMREGSGDDDSSDNEPRGRAETRAPGDKKKMRRDSSEENVNWMVKEMQKHADQLAADRGDLDDLESASSRSEGPPDNTFDFTNKARHSLEPLSPIGEHPMPYIPREPLASHPTKSNEPSYFGPAATYNAQPPPTRPIGQSQIDTDMPDAPPLRPTVPASQIPPESGFARQRGAFGRFFGYPNQVQDKAAEKAYFRLQTRRSPPMAGKDLTFRMCPSPKQTKLDPEQKWDTSTGALAEPNRDITGQFGLWRGYCFTQNKGAEALAPSRRPAMIVTPMAPATPFENSDAYVTTNGTLAPYTISAEPTPLNSGQTSAHMSTSEHRSRAGQPKGLHMLMGLEQRLQKEKVVADLDERIAAEFTDTFVTQVYNYLSLGYPATARAFDDELSKISRIPTDELEKEDEAVMDGIGSRAKGHIKISMDLDMTEDKRCPRWKALKQYIFEWARQHPNLDSITPLTWGVAERRGSWGI